MQIVTLAILVIVGLVLSFVIGFLIYLVVNRNKLRVRIIMPDGKIESHKNVKIDKSFDVAQGTFNYRAEMVCHDFWGKQIFYYKGCSEPIDMRTGKQDISPETLKKIIKAELIRKLADVESTKEDIKQAMQIGVIVLLVAVILILFLKNPKIELINSPHNQQLITEWCRQAFTGG